MTNKQEQKVTDELRAVAPEFADLTRDFLLAKSGSVPDFHSVTKA